MRNLLLLYVFIVTASMQAQQFWTETHPFLENPSYFVKNISIVSENVVWVLGSDSDVANSVQKWSRSLDGGTTWNNGNIELGNLARIANTIHAVSATTAYVSCYPFTTDVRGGVWVTTDAGITWTQQQPEMFSDTYSFPEFIHFWDSNNGVVVGDPIGNYFEIYTTVDGGNNWTRVPQANLPELYQGNTIYPLRYDVQDDTIWFITNQNGIFKSVDRGFNWSFATGFVVDMNDLYTYNFSFKNTNDGLTISSSSGGYPGEYLFSNSGGLDWNSIYPNGKYRSKIVKIPQTSGAYFSFGYDSQDGWPGASFTSDNGLNWIDLNTTDSNPIAPETAKFLNPNVGYCSGYYLSETNKPSRRFFRLANAFLKTDTFEVDDAFTASPNPTSGIVNLSGKPMTKVQVWDISGKLILTEDHNALSQIALNLSTFEAGIYFARIFGHSGNSNTIKILKK